MKDRNEEQDYTGPGFFNMRHSENSNKDNQYRYDKIWYTDKYYNEEGGKEIISKYVFGKLVREHKKEKPIEGDA